MARDRHQVQATPPDVRRLIDSQIAYYDARAAEYDESLGFRSGDFAPEGPDAASMRLVQRVLRRLPVADSTLELACGTGIWTRDLLKATIELHAVDASNRMITLNRAACRGRVTYECADIFEWEPTRSFERIAAAFFLSHVPDELVDRLVETIRRANTDGGEVILIDEARAADDEADDTDVSTVRRLADGSEFTIVKTYRDVEEICDLFARARYRATIKFSAGRFFLLCLTKA